MSKMSRSTIKSTLQKEGRFLYLTHGAESVYQVNGMGGTVPRKLAEELCGMFPDSPMQRKGEAPLIAQEDGLFPGFSQTWRAQS